MNADRDEVRPWHWLRCNARSATPRIFTVIATQTTAEAVDGEPNKERNVLRAWGAWTVNTRQKTPRPHFAWGPDPLSFYAHLAAVKRERTSHWVFGHRLGDSLTLLEFWAALEAKQFWVHATGDYKPNLPRRLFLRRPGWAGALILEDPPTWIKCRWPAGVLNWVDVRNYVDLPLEDFAAAAQVELPPDPDELEGPDLVAAALEAECKAVGGWLAATMTTWRSEDCGHWRPTGSGLAWNAYRHKFLQPKEVLIHSNPDALALERASYVGGRCIVGYVGEVKPARRQGAARKIGRTPLDYAEPRGPVWVYDVNSLYPAMMSAHDYPSRLHCVRGSATIDQLGEWCKTFCLVASVLVNSSDRAYPLRVGKKVHWRRGKFWCVLTTPEIAIAIQEKAIVDVGQVACYARRNLFAGYVKWAYGKKSAGRAVGDLVAETFGKILCVGLYGKWGQIRQGWQDLAGVEMPGVWGTFARFADGQLEPSFYRSLGRAVQEHWRQGETLDSFPAIAAHVTAYARVCVDRFLEALPEKTLLYHDTDSFHVLAGGHSHLQFDLAAIGAGLGQLRVAGPYRSAEYFGQKHYRLDDEYALGSMSAARRLVAGGEFEVDQGERLPSTLSHRPAAETVITRQRRTVDSMPVDRAIGKDGWTETLTYLAPEAASLKRQARLLEELAESVPQAQQQTLFTSL